MIRNACTQGYTLLLGILASATLFGWFREWESLSLLRLAEISLVYSSIYVPSQPPFVFNQRLNLFKKVVDI